MQPIPIVLFGSKQAERRILSSISSPGDVQLAASTHNVTALFSLVDQTRPALLLLEADSDDAALILVQSIRAQYPRLKLLLLLHQIDAAQVREFIRMGVSGCVLLASALDGLENDIRLVQTGKLILSSEITQALLML